MWGGRAGGWADGRVWPASCRNNLYGLRARGGWLVQCPTQRCLPASPAVPHFIIQRHAACLPACPALPCPACLHQADLGGILDFTGELGRVAIVQATKRDEAAVQRARDLVEAIMGQFLRLDLR